MRLVSVNIGQPQKIPYNGRELLTSFVKAPVSGAIQVDAETLVGDKVADPKFHGGEFMAVYAYGANHYSHWEKVLAQPLSYGAFGENLTFSKLDEADLCIGDQLQINDVILAITQFRVPCFKLAARYQRPDLPELFTEYSHTGVYFKVLQTGTLQQGDEVSRIYQHPSRVSVKAAFEAYFKPASHANAELLRSAATIDCVSDEWQKKFINGAKRKQKK